MIHLPGVLAAAEEIQAFCQRQQWRFCFIGGVAVQRWGEPRLTQDVDLTLLTGFGGEEAYVDALLSQFHVRRQDARQFALDYRVLLARTGSGVDVVWPLERSHLKSGPSCGHRVGVGLRDTAW